MMFTPFVKQPGGKPRKNKRRALLYLMAALLILPALLPVLYTLAGSFMPQEQLQCLYFALHGGKASLVVLPQGFTLQGYYEVFLASPRFLSRFWISLFICLTITMSTLIISAMAGLALAKYRFPGKRLLYGAMILFMLLPLQVTLMPNYLVLDQLGLLNSYAALILPSVFLPIGTFLLTFTFKKIPDEVLEAARLDGAGTFSILLRIVVPFGKVGIASLGVLSFIDSWNMVEQPMVFLQDSSRYPLSVFLADLQTENFPLQFVCGILCMLPVTLIFFLFREELIQGFDLSGIKG